MTSRTHRLIAVLPIAALALAGCSDDSVPSGDAGTTIAIVASTNVYGDIAYAVAGGHAEVTSLITSSAQDPHEYEASAQDRLAVQEADIVVKNGGGYDGFVDTLIAGADPEPVTLDAVDISGLAPADEHGDEHGDEHADEHEGHQHIEGFNEHVWYDFHTVQKVAEALSDELGRLDPDNADSYRANYGDFAAEVEELEASAERLEATAEGRAVAITEPVPLYLLNEVGLVNRTPEEFSEAVEEGADVPPRVLRGMLDLFDGGDVALLAYNSQTADGTTEQVRKAAEAADVPVVDFTETLPEGRSYVAWQQDNLHSLAAALG